MGGVHKPTDAPCGTKRIMVRLRPADGIAAAEVAAGLFDAAAECVLGYKKSELLVSYSCVRPRRFRVKLFDPGSIGARSCTSRKKEEKD